MAFFNMLFTVIKGFLVMILVVLVILGKMTIDAKDRNEAALIQGEIENANFVPTNMYDAYGLERPDQISK